MAMADTARGSRLCHGTAFTRPRRSPPHGTRMSGEVPADAAKLKWRSHELTGKTREEDHESWMKRCGTRAFTRVRAPHTHETLRFGVPPPTRSCCRQTVSSLKQSPPCLTRAPPPAFLTASAVRQMGGWSEDDMRKPLIMVAAPYTNASSCNHHFDQLAKHISDAVEEAGGKA